MTTTKDQRLAAARHYYGPRATDDGGDPIILKWIDDGVEADDHTGIDDGVCRVARLLAEREAALHHQVATLTADRIAFIGAVERLTKERDDLDAKAGRLLTSEASASAAFRESTRIHILERDADRARLAAMAADNARHVKTIATLVDALETARPSVEALTTVDDPDDDDVAALEVIDAALAAANL